MSQLRYLYCGFVLASETLTYDIDHHHPCCRQHDSSEFSYEEYQQGRHIGMRLHVQLLLTRPPCC